MSQIDISIIIPSFNEEKFIRNSILSFINQKTSFSFEILIADGNSTDNTQIEIKKFSKDKRVHLLINEKRTAPFALNLGISNAQGRYIMIAGAHALYPETLIQTLISFLDDNNEYVCAGTNLNTLAADNSKVSEAIALASSSPFGVGNSMFRIGVQKPTSVDTVAFGCYRKKVFDNIGLFDTTLTRNQDDEFNARLIKYGGRIALLPDPIITYYSRDSFSKLFLMFYQYGLFKPLVNKKLNKSVSLRQFAPPLYVATLLIGTIVFPIYHYLIIVTISSYFIFLVSSIFLNSNLKNEFISITLYTFSIFIIHLSYGSGFIIGSYNLLRKKSDQKINSSR